MWAHLHFCVRGWWTKGGESGMCECTAGYVVILTRHVSVADEGWLKPPSYLTPSHSRGNAGGCTPYPLTLNVPHVPLLLFASLVSINVCCAAQAGRHTCVPLPGCTLLLHVRLMWDDNQWALWPVKGVRLVRPHFQVVFMFRCIWGAM
jgi:hypothetical protein